ncbi:MAG: winged helix-turn-helix domain-containing tetratricopeptide repeat protein [Candidatus Wenzhouxiangella sp. M2_3B_020]
MAFESGFLLHRYRVRPDENAIVGPEGEIRISPRAMEVLVLLSDRAGEVVSREEFSDEIWGSAVVTDDALTRCISELRNTLGDDAGQPRFIKTVPKRGYCLIAPVTRAGATATDGPQLAGAGLDGIGVSGPRRRKLAYGAMMLAVVVAILSWLHFDRPVPAEPSLAVLPFEALGTVPDDPYVTGIHHDLLTLLSRIEGLNVISSTSVRQYAETTRTIEQIADELGVSHILEGAVQRDGDRIRVNAQLIDAATDTHLWANAWERTLSAENLFAIQAEIAGEIADSLEAAVRPVQRRAPTDNLAAYTPFIRARSLLDSRGEEDMRRAGDLFRTAVSEDESFAEAWAGIADVANLQAYYGYADPESVLPRGRDAAMRALEIDPDNAYALSTLGAIEMQLEHDGPAALEHLRRAHEIDPSKRGWLGWVEAVLGNIRAGVARLERGLERNPFSASLYFSLATLELASDNPETARDLARRAQELSPGYAAAYLTEAQALLVLEDPEAAIALIDRSLEYAGSLRRAEPLGWLAAALARSGRQERARKLLPEIRETGEWFALGLAHTGLGEHEQAIAAFSRAEWNDIHTLHLRYHPFLDPLRDDPAFVALLNELDRWWGLEP